MPVSEKMMVKSLVKQLEDEVGDPCCGLPEHVFIFASGITPMVNVDLLIKRTDGRTLLTWREDGYWKPGWHIPGGVIRYKETIADRLNRTALAELGAGLKPNFIFFGCKEFIHPTRKARGHFISLLYRCELAGRPDLKLKFRSGKPRPGQWAWHEKCPKDLISVHEVYRQYI